MSQSRNALILGSCDRRSAVTKRFFWNLTLLRETSARCPAAISRLTAVSFANATPSPSFAASVHCEGRTNPYPETPGTAVDAERFGCRCDIDESDGKASCILLAERRKLNVALCGNDKLGRK